MPLILQNSIFLHVPKTGGTWVKKALINGKVKMLEIGDRHDRLDAIYHVMSEDEISPKTIFLFIRHPITWYQSRWAFRMQHGWESNHELDINCASNDFNSFIRNCYEKYPTGWYTHEFNRFRNIPKYYKTFIGKQEQLSMDLLRVLDDCNEQYDVDGILNTKHANLSIIGNKSSSQIAKYLPETEKMVLEMEATLINEHY